MTFYNNFPCIGLPISLVFFVQLSAKKWRWQIPPSVWRSNTGVRWDVPWYIAIEAITQKLVLLRARFGSTSSIPVPGMCSGFFLTGASGMSAEIILSLQIVLDLTLESKTHTNTASIVIFVFSWASFKIKTLHLSSRRLLFLNNKCSMK